MLDKIREKIKNNIAKENTLRQNILDVFWMSYAPSLVLVGYYIIPNGKQIMERFISYEFWLVISVILMFSFVLTPLFKGIQQYRDKKNAR